jgi:Domain of unknown function (DUF4331)
MSPSGRRRQPPFPLATALLAACAGLPVTVDRAEAASHREAPLITEDPLADNTDVYAFVAPDNSGTLTLIANYVPLEDPASGPNFYRFSDDVVYEIKIDVDRNALEDLKYVFRFQTEIRRSDPLPYGGTSSLLPITSLDGPGSEGIGVRQTYTVTRVIGRDGKFKKRDQLSLDLGTMVVVPPDVGTQVTPGYDTLAQQGVYPLANGGRIFVGPRDDPFFVDIGAISDALNFRRTPPLLTPSEDADDTANSFGRDAFAGFNVHSIVLEVPLSEVFGITGDPDPDTVIGIWATASRGIRTIRKGVPRLGKRDDRDDLLKTGGAAVQVSRVGNPLINELLIATSEKDLFNATAPITDAGRIAFFLEPAIAPLLGSALGTTLPLTGRADLVQRFLKYPGQDPNLCTKESPCADILRLDLSIPPAAPGGEKRLGALAGDGAGFPNGRRPGDDVSDVLLRLVAANPGLPVGDGVNTNDEPLLTSFPYLPTPHRGYDTVRFLCPTPTASPVTVPTPTPTATPDAGATPTPAPTDAPPATPTPTATGGAFACTGVHAIPDPANPSNGHLFDGGTCNQSMAELVFRIASGTSYTSFTIPMPEGELTSTLQPNDTVRGTNPDPAGTIKTQIQGATFTTAGSNPIGVEVIAKNAAGDVSQHGVTIPGPP